MNQRSSRRRNKNNNLDFVSLNSGGLTARHSPHEDPQVQIPQKATGDVKPETPQGVAKASPNFKPVVPSAKTPDQQTEKKVIAENSTPVQPENKKVE